MNTGSKTNLQRGTVLVLISALMFGSYGVWSRLIGNSFAPFFQGWTRGLILSLVLFPILFYRKEIVPIVKKDWLWVSVFLVSTSLTQAPIFYAFNHMDIGTATLLFFVSMLLTMYMYGFVFLNEKFTPVKVISFTAAIIGLYLVFSFSLIAFSLLAAFLAVVNGVASGSEVSSSKKLSGTYSPLYISALSWLIIAITNAIVSVAIGEPQRLPAFDIAWFYQLWYSAVSIIGFWAIIAGLKHIEASIGGLIGLLEIIFSISFGMLLFQEVPTLRIIIGAVLILVAASLPYVAELIAKRRKLARV